MRRPTHPPADDPAGEGVNDQGHVDEEVLFEDTAYLDLEGNVAAGADRQAFHVQAFGNVLIIG
ncbi:hypothetical protein ADU59_28285 [Pararhizobium polonicum]|uniref:Uncharacterized protein n=1 Tax=Pararhizobium polonicum TaxID=1612624 RepID=A0A1C7NTT5_9HYPH|nr:hypothetical protein ADU59_28285 [Pararhizobium polonicum]